MSEDLFQQYLTIITLSLVGVLILRRFNMASIVAYIIVRYVIVKPIIHCDYTEDMHF